MMVYGKRSSRVLRPRSSSGLSYRRLAGWETSFLHPKNPHQPSKEKSWLQTLLCLGLLFPSPCWGCKGSSLGLCSAVSFSSPERGAKQVSHVLLTAVLSRPFQKGPCARPGASADTAPVSGSQEESQSREPSFIQPFPCVRGYGVHPKARMAKMIASR